MSFNENGSKKDPENGCLEQSTECVGLSEKKLPRNLRSI